MPSGESTYYSSAVVSRNTSPGDINVLSWNHVELAQVYRVYRGVGSGPYDLELLREVNGETTSYVDDGVDEILGGNPPTSGTVNLDAYPLGIGPGNRQVINFAKMDSGDSPLAGSTLGVDYDFYIGRHDVIYASRRSIGRKAGAPAVIPKIPIVPNGTLGLCSVYCPPNSTEMTLTNYGLMRVPMDRLFRLVQEVDKLKYQVVLSMLFLPACSGTQSHYDDEPDISAGPLVEEAPLASKKEQRQQADQSESHKNISSVRIFAKLSLDGELEIIDAVETRSRGRLTNPVGEFIYEAAVKGKVVAVGSFEDPFTRRSMQHPASGYDYELPPQHKVMVVMNLVGVNLESTDLDLSVWRLTKNSKIKTLDLDNVAELKRRGVALELAHLPTVSVRQGLALGRLSVTPPIHDLGVENR